MLELLFRVLEVMALLGASALAAWEFHRKRKNLDSTHVAGQQVVNQLRKEVENLKAEQGRQRWYVILLAIIVVVVGLAHIIPR